MIRATLSYTLLLLLLFPLNIHAQQTALVLTDEQTHYPIGAELGLIQAPPGTITIDTLTAPDSPTVFSSTPPKRRNIGYTPDTVWARFQIRNNSPYTDWWIEGDHPRIQNISLYQQTVSGDWQPLTLGTSTPVEERPINHRANLFPVTIKPGETRTFYLEVSTHTSINLTINVWRPSAFIEATDQRTALHMLLGGVLLGIGIYYLLVTFILREALYCYFSLFILSFLAYFAIFNGFFHQYISGLSGDQPLRALTLSITIANVFYLAYSRYFLQTRRFSPGWHYLLNGLMIISIILTGLCLWIESLAIIQWVSILGPVNTASSLGAGIAVLYKGYRPARLFVLTLFIFFLAITVHNVGTAGYLNMPRILNETGLLITLMGVIPLFAVSFADRYNLLRQDNEATQQRALDAERQLTQSLEKQVAERTHELHRAKDKAEAASAAKGEFLAVMSHELRTPMTAVLGAAQLMDKASLTAENQHLLSTVDNAGQQLLALINDVLDMAKVEQGELALNNQIFQPEQALRDAIALTQPMADERGLALSLVIETLPAQVIGDPVRIRQVLVNLIANAIKFTEHGQINVRAEPLDADEGYLPLLISVEDTGCGIPAELQSSIFHPFEQVSKSSGLQQDGIGLGLAICQRLITAMGGTIDVESQPGQGSRFWFTVDLRRVTTETATPQITQVIPDPLHILLADDTDINREIISKLLQRDGHRVTAVSNGQAVLDSLDNAPFDLVLMDIQMPGMNGLQTTQKIRQHADPVRAAVPVIALTASATCDMIERCHAAGMDGWAGKPLRLQELYSSLALHRDGWLTKHGQSNNASPQLPPDYQHYLTPDEQQQLILKQRASLQQADSRLRTAMLNNDLAEIAQAAHALAGSAGMMGLADLMQTAQQLETAASQVQPAPIAALFERYQQQYKACQHSLALPTANSPTA